MRRIFFDFNYEKRQKAKRGGGGCSDPGKVGRSCENGADRNSEHTQDSS
jgi:hypothetical protein